MKPWLLLKTSYLIYQQEDYLLRRWWQWWKSHPFTVITAPKKKLVLTSRIFLLLFAGSVFWLVILVILLLQDLYWQMLALIALLLVVPVLVFVCGVILLWPLVLWSEMKREQYLANEIKRKRDLIKIGITGSYGKTSVKELLFNILNLYRYTLMSPDNFNTISGLGRVVAAELHTKHRYFIAEMGAYLPGDIKRMCNLVKPEFGILTAVGPQHLERFGSVAGIAQTKSELIQAIPAKHTIVNWDSDPLRRYLIQNNLIKRTLRVSKNDPSVEFVIEKIKMDTQGISFTMNHLGKNYSYNSPLFGTASVYNCALAAAMAMVMGIPQAYIEKGLLDALPSPHRLELTPIGDATLIDNTYSGNVDSFMALATDLSILTGKKLLVTPGVVELGEAESEHHRRMGNVVANTYDAVVLVGKNNKTRSMYEGLQQAKFMGKVDWLLGGGYQEYWQKISEASSQYDWIILENDLPERYL